MPLTPPSEPSFGFPWQAFWLGSGAIITHVLYKVISPLIISGQKELRDRVAKNEGRVEQLTAQNTKLAVDLAKVTVMQEACERERIAAQKERDCARVESDELKEHREHCLRNHNQADAE